MAKHYSAKKIATGAVLATAVGYLAKILSKSTEDDPKGHFNHKDAEARVKFLHDELSELLLDAKEEGKSLSGKHKDKFELAQIKAKEAKDKLNKLILAAKDNGSSDKDLDKALKEAEKALGHFKEFLLKK